MEQNSPKHSAALAQLVEAAELVAMVEELCGGGNPERLAPALWAGMRITLRNARRTILNSHDAIAGELLQRVRSGRPETGVQETKVIETQLAPKTQPMPPIGPATQLASSLRTTGFSAASPDSAAPFKRRDLRGALEKLTEG